MKGYAFVEEKDSKLFNEEIKIKTKLIVGDFIKFYPDAYDERFTESEVDNGITLEVLKRVYSTIDGMLYFCKHTGKYNISKNRIY
jgi:hypothetical protein